MTREEEEKMVCEKCPWTVCEKHPKKTEELHISSEIEDIITEDLPLRHFLVIEFFDITKKHQTLYFFLCEVIQDPRRTIKLVHAVQGSNNGDICFSLAPETLEKAYCGGG